MVQRRIAMISACVLLCLAACKGKSGEETSAGQPAGSVTEVTGVVKAERAGQMHALRVGDKVFGSDVIATEPGASVAVRLAHNGAVWRLEGGKKRQLDKTAAWRAPAAGSAALAHSAGTDETAAAGRHGERSAVDTRATAREEAKEAKGAPSKGGASLEPPGGVSPGTTAPTTGGESRTDRPDPGMAMDMPPNKARDGTQLRRRRSKSDKAAKGRRDFTGDSDSDKGGGDPLGEGGVALARRAAPAAAAVVFHAAKVKGAVPATAVSLVMKRHTAAMATCYDKARARRPDLEGDVILTFTVASTGLVSAASAAGTITDAGMRGCVVARVRAIRFPSSNDGGNTVITLRVSFGSP